MDFDEGEALLAIVSVSAFAKLLVDQVAERLTFNAVKAELKENPPPEIEGPQQDLVGRVSAYLQEFAQTYAPSRRVSDESEGQLIGALSAFLAAAAPDFQITVEAVVGAPAGSGASRRADMVVSDGQRTIVVEVKRRYLHALAAQGIEQMKSYVPMTKSVGGVLFFAGEPGDDFTIERRDLGDAPQGLAIVASVKYLGRS